MGVSVVTTTAKSNDTSSSATTAPIDTTGATLIVVELVGYASTDPVLDSKLNPWTYGTYLAGNVKSILAYCLAPTVGPGHTFTNTASFPALAVAAFSGGTFTFDQETGSFNTADTLQPGAMTPAANGSLLVTGYGFDKTGTPTSLDSGFTVLSEADWASAVSEGCAIGYFVQGTAAPINPTWTRITWSGAETAGSMMSFGFTPSSSGVVGRNRVRSQAVTRAAVY